MKLPQKEQALEDGQQSQQHKKVVGTYPYYTVFRSSINKSPCVFFTLQTK
jgi:hypothetical protein